MNVAAKDVEEAVSKASAIVESTEAWRYLASRGGAAPEGRQGQKPG